MFDPKEPKRDYREYYDSFDPAQVVADQEWEELLAKIKELDEE